jgi:ATP-dependent exoDNAse (exonuclease V) beta subunit
LDTNDTIAWLSLLRAPWCGLRLADLLALREVPGISVLSQLTSVIKSDEAGTKIVDSDAISRLKSVFLVLSESLAERSRKSLVDWVKGCWLALGGAEGLNLADHNNVERFFDALAECDETTLIQRPERLQNLLAELYALPNHDAGNQIQVMTMHKSKGLEFDVVFLVGLASATGAPEAPLMRWHEQLFDNDSAGAKGIAHSDRAQAISWLLSPIGERGQDRDSLYDWLGYQQKKREHLEACRLLYVACTRAKKQLYLTAVFYQKEGGEFPAPGKGSLLSHIWPTVEMAFRQTAIKIEPLEHLNHNGGLDIADNLPNLRRLVTPRRYSKKLITMPGTEIHPSDLPSTTAAIISTAGQNFVQNSQPITDQSDSLARALGSITHEILEVIVPAEIKTFGEIRTIQKQWSPFFESWRQRLEQLLRSQSLSAERLSILREDLAAQIPVIVNHLDKVFSNQSPLCLALKGAREIHPECEINGPDENGDIREWRIDLWWRNNQGQVYLLDYKTALCPQTIAVDVFENSQRALYENGVKRYAKLLSQTLDELVIPVLYLIDTHSWLIIEE